MYEIFYNGGFAVTIPPLPMSNAMTRNFVLYGVGVE